MGAQKKKLHGRKVEIKVCRKNALCLSLEDVSEEMYIQYIPDLERTMFRIRTQAFFT